MKITHYIYMGLTVLGLASCATQKSQAQENVTITENKADTEANAVLNRVYDNEVYQRNVVSKMTFTLNKGQDNVSVPGQIRMRKDAVIRLQLQLPLLGSEVGRLEFTPTEVLFVDRIHKRYCRASYDDVSFLAENGISFYTLQALFWNKLTLPGEESVGYGNLQRFSVGTKDATTDRVPVSVENGKLSFEWLTEAASGLIREADVTYRSTAHGTSALKWSYDNFKSFGSKKYPHTQTIAVSTNATGKQKNMKVTLELDGATADDAWDATTTVSDRYTEVTVEELLSQLITL